MEGKFKINNNLIIEKENDKLVAYDVGSNSYIKFNKTGSFILKELKKAKESSFVLKKLLKIFSVSEKKASKDFTDFLHELLRLKLIEKV